LEPGEHPFIRRRTCVTYQWLKVVEVSHLVALETLNADGQDYRARSFTRHRPVADQLLSRIREAAMTAEQAEKGAVRILREWLGR
jgi:hypothetical protein